jgi:hypothetical protein
MLTRFFFALVVIVLQQNVLGILLGCHHCPHLIVYHFIVTNETLPTDFLRDCAYLMSQQSCTIDVEIDFDKQQTIMNVSASTEYVDTSITAITTIENGLKHKRYISFWCSDRYGGCNNEYYLKRVFQSLNINGSFKELEPLLIPTNETLDNSSCLVFSNTTATECQSECQNNNKACYIESLVDVEQSFEICAHCSSMSDYYVMYAMTFFINNLSISQSDHRRLSCAFAQCNSVTNLERMSQLMTIDFDATLFFNTTTTTIISPTTTTDISTASILRMSDWYKYGTLLIFLATSFFCTII